MTLLFAFGHQEPGASESGRSASSITMRTLIIVAALLAFSLSAFAEADSLPTFTVTSNDVAQSSIMVFRTKGTNEAKVSIKFAFTDTGGRRVEELYRAHSVGQQVRYQIGRFERLFKLDDRKHFGREGFWGLSEGEAGALESGLRGRK